ncbi:MAG: hypothetical protein JXR64_10535 [Spirochaetales bacterium]|nr:hypothetical protein [Spirochaetales bacterium]
MKKIILLITALSLNIHLFSVEVTNSEIIKFSNEFYNYLDNFLRLNTTQQSPEYNLEIVENKEEYNKLLTDLNIPLRDDFIFVLYNNQDKTIVYKSNDFDFNSLKFHLTLNYLNRYSSEIPNWMAFGIATYNEGNNDKLLDSIKQKGNYSDIYSSIRKDQNSSNEFSWLLIDYLQNSGVDESKRAFWDILSILKYETKIPKNILIEQILDRLNLDENLKNYIESTKNYTDLMNEGIELYIDNKYKESLDIFLEAIQKQPENYSPEYYAGLCYSKLLEYNLAYSHFSLSLDKNAPKDIVYYSIGVNFYNNNDYVSAKKYLNKIEDKMYAVMSEKILDEISKF